MQLIVLLIMAALVVKFRVAAGRVGGDCGGRPVDWWVVDAPGRPDGRGLIGSMPRC
jgi:hypothetical protein